MPVLKPMAEITEAEFDAMFNVNMKSIFFAQQLCATMMNEGGRIINLSSHTTALFIPTRAVSASQCFPPGPSG